MKVRLLLALILAAPSFAQFGQWLPSPSRPDVWFNFLPIQGTVLSSRALVETTYPGLDVELASIASAQEEALVVGTWGGTQLNGLLIGLTDFLHEGHDVWLDGSPVTYTNWGVGNGLSNPSKDFSFIVTTNLPLRWLEIDACNSLLEPVFVLHSTDCDANGQPDTWEIYNNSALDLNANGVLDVCESIGTPYCTATINSSGLPAVIVANGSPAVAANALVLRSNALPQSEFGYFMMSTGTGFVAMFGGGAGNLCLANPIVRLNSVPGGILNSGAGGAVALPLDLTIANHGAAIQVGETWNFQYWTRDVFTSNTSNGLAIGFQ